MQNPTEKYRQLQLLWKHNTLIPLSLHSHAMIPKHWFSAETWNNLKQSSSKNFTSSKKQKQNTPIDLGTSQRKLLWGKPECNCTQNRCFLSCTLLDNKSPMCRTALVKLASGKWSRLGTRHTGTHWQPYQPRRTNQGPDEDREKPEPRAWEQELLSRWGEEGRGSRALTQVDAGRRKTA